MKTSYSFILSSIAGSVIACILFTPIHASAYEKGSGLSSMIGTDLRLMDMKGRRKTFFAGNIPTFEVGVPIAKRYFLFEIGFAMEWGYSKFYADRIFLTIPSLGLRWYPSGQYFSVYTKGSWGTFLFNNSTWTGEYGVNIDIPYSETLDGKSYLTLGFGYFHRKCSELAGFIDKPQWYITSNGPLFTIGFRFRDID
jgi:hypothetical protein